VEEGVEIALESTVCVGGLCRMHYRYGVMNFQSLADMRWFS